MGAIAAATAAFLVGLVLVVHRLMGLLNPGPVGWTLPTLAAWGLLVRWTMTLAFCALLADPDGQRDVRSALRLASLLVVAHPARLGGFGLLTAVLAAVSVLPIMPVLTISVAFLALLTCHFVLPAADRLEAALAMRTDAETAR